MIQDALADPSPSVPALQRVLSEATHDLRDVEVAKACGALEGYMHALQLLDTVCGGEP